MTRSEQQLNAQKAELADNLQTLGLSEEHAKAAANGDPAAMAKARALMDPLEVAPIEQQPSARPNRKFVAQATAQSDGTIFSGYKGAWVLAVLGEANPKPTAQVVTLADRRKPHHTKAAAAPAPGARAVG